MTTQNELPTKTQLNGLIAVCVSAGLMNAAGLLSIASDEISQYVRENTDEETCCCYEIMGDNPQCPHHGNMFKSPAAWSYEDYKADYQERSDLYNMGMGA